jgi:site-specific DNA-methyltransferase (adenine-specific)
VEGKNVAIKKILVSVKGGEDVCAPMIRDLAGTLQANKAEIGLFISLAEPTRPMQTEAAKARVYTAAMNCKQYPRLQLLTIEDLLSGKTRPEFPDMSMGTLTFPQAVVEDARRDQRKLF